MPTPSKPRPRRRAVAERVEEGPQLSYDEYTKPAG